MIPLPQWVDAEAWAGFVEMRKSIKKPLTPRAALLILRDLQQIKDAGHDPNAALDQSTVCGWRGVWPSKEKRIESAAPVQTNQWLKEHANREYTAPPPELKELAKKLRRVA